MLVWGFRHKWRSSIEMMVRFDPPMFTSGWRGRLIGNVTILHQSIFILLKVL
jgi:hypothetical protein